MRQSISIFRRVLLLTLAAVLIAAALSGCAVDPGNEPAASVVPGDDEPAEPTAEPEKEIDMSEFPLYVDPAEAVYAFGERGKATKAWNNQPVYAPYWLGNIIYQETVLCIDDGTEISGRLQYTPVKILSVRDNTYKTEYEEGKDYTLSGDKLILSADGACPYLTTENLMGRNMPAKYRSVSSLAAVSNIETDYYMWTDNIFFTEGSLIYGHQVCVSYVYDIKDVDRSQFAAYGSVAPRFLDKLKNGEDVVISVTGDSVTEGCSASSKFNHEPLMPQFVTLLTYALKEHYTGKITLKNYAVGGTTSNEAVSKDVSKSLVKAKSDLVLVHFGINDSGGLTASKYKSNIKTVIDTTRESLPECEFLLIKCFTPNPGIYSDKTFQSFWKALDELAAEYDGVYTLDLYTPSQIMLEKKNYLDVTGNGINHPNDYIVRFYAMNLVNLFVDFKA